MPNIDFVGDLVEEDNLRENQRLLEEMEKELAFKKSYDMFHWQDDNIVLQSRRGGGPARKRLNLNPFVNNE